MAKRLLQKLRCLRGRSGDHERLDPAKQQELVNTIMEVLDRDNKGKAEYNRLGAAVAERRSNQGRNGSDNAGSGNGRAGRGNAGLDDLFEKGSDGKRGAGEGDGNLESVSGGVTLSEQIAAKKGRRGQAVQQACV